MKEVNIHLLYLLYNDGDSELRLYLSLFSKKHPEIHDPS